jgi:hypothetical protein
MRGIDPIAAAYAAAIAVGWVSQKGIAGPENPKVTRFFRAVTS